MLQVENKCSIIQLSKHLHICNKNHKDGYIEFILQNIKLILTEI
jgi:hypothetical protein